MWALFLFSCNHTVHTSAYALNFLCWLTCLTVARAQIYACLAPIQCNVTHWPARLPAEMCTHASTPYAHFLQLCMSVGGVGWGRFLAPGQTGRVRQTHPVGSASAWLLTHSSAPNLILALCTKSLLLRLLSVSKMLQVTRRGEDKGLFYPPATVTVKFNIQQTL